MPHKLGSIYCSLHQNGVAKHVLLIFIFDKMKVHIVNPNTIFYKAPAGGEVLLRSKETIFK
jgi:hypothetical protein